MANSTVTDDLNTALSEQCRMLTAAKTLDSDLDLAYQLQMEEAMNASIALQPSTSRQPNFNDAVSSDDDVFDVAETLMLQDLQDHLDRPINHIINIPDEEWESDIINFPDEEWENDIINISDEEWEVYEHNYRRPYHCTDPSSSSWCSSSSTGFVDTESFRLYFKGLLSEESVRDRKVTVGGAGVAICDPRDSLILEARKNLEAWVDGQVVSYEIAELEALIEGLNKALSLDLKRLTFFCDDYMLYQYVTGRVPPRQSKIATLVNQVALLQRKFTYCYPSLVARNDVKFAMKSARDAIVSQITCLKETCVICFEDTDADKMFAVDGCLHRYCFSCMKQHVEVKFLNGMMAKCPHEGCKSEVNIDSCGKFLAPKLRRSASSSLSLSLTGCKMVASAISLQLSFSIASRNRTSSIPLYSRRNSTSSIVSALPSPYGDSLTLGLSSKTCGLPRKCEEKDFHDTSTSYEAIEARKGGNPPVMPAVMTPGGPLDLSSVLFRNRIIFIGQPINSQVAQRVISQLVTLATIDENADILVYLNCPGGSTYSVLAIYDCMSWIKPKVGTVCFGVAASQGALLLAGGEKGMRYAMPNARIMIHQPQSGCGGHVEDVRRQVNEAVQSRHKIDKMYVAFTGQPLEKVQQYTERDRFLSVSEAMEFGLIDGVLETEY